MIEHKPLKETSSLSVEANAFRKPLRNGCAYLRVIALLPLADVMKQRGENQDFGPLQPAYNICIR
jgi:hypothetical protein